MTKLTSGIASALASGETSENCWNISSSSGSVPRVTAHCVAPQLATTRRQPRPTSSRAVPTKKSRPTATKDNQKPGASTAQGSISSTSNSASSRLRLAPRLRPDHSASATTLSMYKVRCVGTAKPASNE
jgi:hypothetical protein